MQKAMTFHTVLILVTVLAPGLIVVTEVGYIILLVQADPSRGTTRAIEELVPSSVALNIVLLLVIVAAALPTGYVVRELGFSLLQWMERRSKLPKVDIYSQLAEHLGQRLVDEFVTLHPPLRYLTDMSPHRSYIVLTYSKLWLRTRVPALKLDTLELEINMSVSAVLPLLLLAVDVGIALPSHLRISGTVVAALLAVLGAYSLLRRMVRRRQEEPWEAVRNLAYDYTMRGVESSYSESHSSCVANRQPIPRIRIDEGNNLEATMPREAL